jgi:hypothetical protein
MFTIVGLWQYIELVRNTHTKIISGKTTNYFILATKKCQFLRPYKILAKAYHIKYHHRICQ